MHCDDSFKTAARISAALLYGKLADDISDERGKKRAAGRMTAEVASLGLSGAQRDIMYEAAFHIGRWIYLADAVCDYPEDMRRGRFNPFFS